MIYINGVFVFILIMAVLNIIKEGFVFAKCYNNTEPYQIDNKHMLILWSAISYIITFFIML